MGYEEKLRSFHVSIFSCEGYASQKIGRMYAKSVVETYLSLRVLC
jgi:hypothetical protein